MNRIETIPRFLYKYRNVSPNSLNILIQNELYFADPLTEFNDPFDSRILPYVEGSKTEVLRYFEKNPKHYDLLSRSYDFAELPDPIPKLFMSETALKSALRTDKDRPIGVLTLSENKADIVMFTHYADNHRGFCLEFDTIDAPEFFAGAMQISYEGYPEINVIKSSDEEKLAALLTKSNQWSYEMEWRIINHIDGQGLYAFPPNMLTSIIFGLDMDKGHISMVKTLLKDRNINFFQAYRAHGKFALYLKQEF